MKLIRPVALALLLSGMAQITLAQTAARPAPAVLNHIAFYVADLKTTTDFYSDLFHLEQIAEPFHDGRHSWFSLGSSGALHLIAGAKVKGTYLIDEHLCFSVPSVEAFIEQLKAKNISYGNFAKAVGQVTLRPDGVRQIYFQDPDGHWLEVNDAKK